MKYLFTIAWVVLLSGVASAQKTTIRLLDSKYFYYGSESTTYFKRLISLDGTTYYVAGHISFDDEGRTIQKLDEFRKDAGLTKIEGDDYVPNSKDPMFQEYAGIAYIQFKNAEGNRERIKNVVARLNNELMQKNAAVDNDLNFDNGVGIAEYFMKDPGVTFQTIFDLLEEEGMIDDVLLGQRVYMDGDDYNVEIFYPLKYEGTFWGF